MAKISRKKGPRSKKNRPADDVKTNCVVDAVNISNDFLKVDNAPSTKVRPVINSPEIINAVGLITLNHKQHAGPSCSSDSRCDS